jgi:predicted negative regulator of RcsB-dependent stress response
MKNNEKGFGAVEGLLVIVIVVLIGVAGWFVYQRRHSSTPSQTTHTQAPTQSGPASREQVKTAADDFLISQVGKDRFAKYYSFEQSRTSYSDPKDSKYAWLHYQERTERG